MFLREAVKLWFFVTFNIIISHIYPENFIEIPQLVQKIWNFILQYKLMTSAYNMWRHHFVTFNLL